MMQVALAPLQTGGEEFAMDPTLILVSTAVFLIISLAIGYWVYKDASKRDNNELLWSIGTAGLTFFTFIFGLVALVAYLIVRGDETAEGSPQDDAASGDW
ncbi:hypothetical protein [Natronorubrum sp. FCH18a]|uniref:hypothetical protein n=1 Tax=Natronorubrum sp. FCH18a TaxID=3447018 RepID=UPI003F519D89